MNRPDIDFMKGILNLGKFVGKFKVEDIDSNATKYLISALNSRHDQLQQCIDYIEHLDSQWCLKDIEIKNNSDYPVGFKITSEPHWQLTIENSENKR